MKKAVLCFIAAVISCCILSPVFAHAALEGPLFDPCNGEPETYDSTAPEFKDYVFDGWYTKQTCGEKVTEGFESGTTYFAHWKDSDAEDAKTVLTEFVQIWGGLFYNTSCYGVTDLSEYGLSFTKLYEGGEVDPCGYEITMDGVHFDFTMDFDDAQNPALNVYDDLPVILKIKGTNEFHIDEAVDLTTWDHDKFRVAIDVANSLQICGSGNEEDTLIISGFCTGISAARGVKVSNGAKLDINLLGSTCRGIQTGIQTDWDEDEGETITDPKIEVDGSTTEIKINVPYDGMYAKDGTVIINNGSIDIKSEIPEGCTNDGATGILASDINIFGGNINIVANGKSTCCMESKAKLIFRGGTTTVSCSNEYAVCFYKLVAGTFEDPATIENAKNITMGFGTVTDVPALRLQNMQQPIVVKFVPLPKHKVTFEANGGLPAPAAQETVALVIEPEAMTRDGKIFAGWFRNAACTDRWDMKSDYITEDTTLYAKWVDNKADISAAVFMEDPENVPANKATVALVDGYNLISTFETGTDGVFTFENIPEGVYTLMVVARKSVGKGTQRSFCNMVCVVVDADGKVTFDGVPCTADTRIILYNSSNIGAAFDIEPGAPDVSVSGLIDVALQYKGVEVSAQLVLAVQALNSENVPAAEKTALEAKAATVNDPDAFILEYLNFILVKENIVTHDSRIAVTDTGAGHLLTIRIPFDMTGKKNVNIYRYHGTEATVFGTTADENGEYVEIGENEILVHARFFSTYAVGYEIDDGKRDITLTNDGHGTVISKAGDVVVTTAVAGDEVTLVVTPATGYVFDSFEVLEGDIVITDGKFTMPDTPVTIKAVFEEDFIPPQTGDLDTPVCFGFGASFMILLGGIGMLFAIESGKKNKPKFEK